jgi:hypothetical protein
MGVVIEICVKYPGGPTRIRVTEVQVSLRRLLGALRDLFRTGISPFAFASFFLGFLSRKVSSFGDTYFVGG